MKLGFYSFFYISRISKTELILENQQKEKNIWFERIIRNNEKKDMEHMEGKKVEKWNDMKNMEESQV